MHLLGIVCLLKGRVGSQMSTKPMKSTKYNIFHMSRHDYPTRIVSNSLIIGHKEARKALEKALDRNLKGEIKVRVRGGNWAFYELKPAKAA
jgi:hypothetical protein